jgi:hypothetical protein
MYRCQKNSPPPKSRTVPQTFVLVQLKMFGFNNSILKFDILAPFRSFEISYHSILDLLIYLISFTNLAQTCSLKFKGKVGAYPYPQISEKPKNMPRANTLASSAT